MRAVSAVVLASIVLCGPVFGSNGNETNSHVRVSQMRPHEEPLVSSQRSINLTEENRHVIREVVLKGSKVSPEVGTARAQIGDIVPTSVTTYDFPDELLTKISTLKSYRYFLNDDSVVIVEANDSRVADVVKAR